MELSLMIIIFLFGLCVGSFLNVLIYRLPRSLPITGRSFCPDCKKKIAWYDNLPLLSFILLKGRCRFCQSPISIQYPLVELLTAFFTIFNFQFSRPPDGQTIFNEFSIFQLSFNLFVTYALIVVFFTDLRYQIIPDGIVYPAIALTGIFRVYQGVSGKITGWEALAAGLGAAGFFWLLYLMTHGRGMGFGDVKLAGLMGLVLGFPRIIVALYLAFLTGALVGVILVITGRKKLKSGIPFGPFLVIGTLFSFFEREILWEKIGGVLP